MKVLLDVTESHASAGVGRYSRSLTRALREMDSLQIQLLAGRWEYQRFLAADPAFGELPVVRKSGAAGWLDRLHCAGLERSIAGLDTRRDFASRLQRRVAGTAADWARRTASGWREFDPHSAEVYHRLCGPLPRHHALPTVLTFFDIIPSHHWEAGAGVARVYERMLASITPDTFVLAISESTRRDFLAATGHPPERTRVTYLGVDRRIFHPIAESPSDAAADPYILSVCTLEARKNLTVVLRSFADLCARAALPRLRLVLTGAKAHLLRARMDELGLAASVRERITLTGVVSDAQLATLYRGALCFVFPSLHEGFGLPVLEAMSCGTPALVAAATSLPEVVGERGVTLDPNDPSVWVAAIERLATDPAWHAEQRAWALEQAARFSWERCARETAEVYQTARAAGR